MLIWTQIKKMNGILWAEAQVFQTNAVGTKHRPSEDIREWGLPTSLGIPFPRFRGNDYILAR
jgi:hypothetical protein